MIGGGQSALESAALLNKAGAKIELLVGAPRIYYLRRARGLIHGLGPLTKRQIPVNVYADQLRERVDRRAQPDVRWIRLLTDVPTAAVELAGGRLDWRAYLRSLVRIDIESVFSRDDPLPGLVELALVPYLVVKWGY